MTRPDELYACVHVREFPAQALLRMRPELRDRACVVMEGDPPLQQVCSLNGRARALGVEHRMTRVEVDTFPAVTVLSRSRKEEAVAKAALLECAGSFSPRVEDCSGDSTFVCVIDIAGTEKLLGPPESLARNLLARAGALGITACAAVSANFHAAVTVARAPLALTVRVIPEGEENTALSALSLTVLDLTEEQGEIFALWGIRTLGMLAGLPEKELISRMGQPARRLRQLARGEMPHLFQPVEPPFALAERMDLDSPVDVFDALLFVVNLMLEQMILRAASRMLALAAVTATLTLEGGATHTRTVRPALPTNDRQIWLKLLHLDLEAHPPQAAILAVALDAETGSTSKVQLGLFSPQLPEPSRLDVTLARIRAVVGEENVGRAVLEDTHRPDGFRMEPFTISAARSSEVPVTPVRPAMWRLRPPEAAFVTLRNERPAAVIFRAQRFVVERAWGPWQTEGEWWTATLWGCEQWDLVARSQAGSMLCCCLVRDLLRDQWQMAALYD